MFTRTLAMLGLAAAFIAPATPAQAADIALTANAGWSAFAVDGLLDDSLAWIDDAGDALAYTFTIGAGMTGTLDVVDAVFAGDTFRVFDGGTLLGATSTVAATDIGNAPDLGLDFDAAFASDAFSHASFTLGAGTYRIRGVLDQSVLIDGTRLDATAGALRLAVAPIPEPGTLALMLAGLAGVAVVARRRR